MYKINAILYTLKNSTLTTQLKHACWECGISLMYETHLANVLLKTKSCNCSVVFLDCEKNSLAQAYIEASNRAKHDHNVALICLNSNVDLISFIQNNKNDNVFIFNNYEDYKVQINKIMDKLLHIDALNNVQTFNFNELRKKLTNYLIKLGFLPKHVGFVYIKNCIEEILGNNGVMGSLSRKIYPSIACKNNTNPQNVERNIRNAIERAYSQTQFLNDDCSLLAVNGKLSNRVFLSYLLDWVNNNLNQVM